MHQDSKSEKTQPDVLTKALESKLTFLLGADGKSETSQDGEGRKALVFGPTCGRGLGEPGWVPAREGEATRRWWGPGQCRVHARDSGPHLGPPVGPPPECAAIRTVVLRTSPDTWFGKKRRKVGVTLYLIAWRGKSTPRSVCDLLFYFQGKKASSLEKGEESTAKLKRRKMGSGHKVEVGDTGDPPGVSPLELVHILRGAPSQQGEGILGQDTSTHWGPGAGSPGLSPT